LFSTAGRDFGEYKSAFTKLGIKTNHVKIYKDTYTATGFGMTDRTNNQVWGFFYGANDFVDKLRLSEIATQKDFVLIGPQGAKGSLSFVKQCVALKIQYMFDPGFILTQVNDEELTLGVTHAKIIIGNDYEISLIKKRLKKFNDIAKDKIVITTLGEKGSIVEEKKQKVVINPAVAKKIVDPSGAGDAWRAGFLAGYEKGYDLQTCGQMGSIAAVYAIEEYGPQEHFYKKQDFTKRYKETYNQTLTI
jgi:adenosine kinase